jgi:hypothetical protein
LSAQNGAEQSAFDRACVLECLARARACAGLPEAGELRDRARRAGEVLADEGTRRSFWDCWMRDRGTGWTRAGEPGRSAG